MLVPFKDFEAEDAVMEEYTPEGPMYSGGVSSGWMDTEPRRPIGFHFEPKTTQLRLPGF